MLRVTEGGSAAAGGGSRRLFVALLLPLVPAVGLFCLVLLFQRTPTPLVLTVSLLLWGPLQFLGWASFLGVAAERLRSTAQGLNEFAEPEMANVPAWTKEGFRAAAFDAAWLLPPAVLLGGVLLLTVPSAAPWLPAVLRAGSPGGTAAAVGLAALALLVLSVYPAARTQASVSRHYAPLRPLCPALAHARRQPRLYATATGMAAASLAVPAFLASPWVMLGLGRAKAGGLVLESPAFVAGGLLVAFVALLLLLLVSMAHWYGQYAYEAYADELEHLVIHETVEPLTEEEKSALIGGPVAMLKRDGGGTAPISYSGGEYWLMVKGSKTVGRPVLRELDARHEIEWLNAEHRRNVLGD